MSRAGKGSAFVQFERWKTLLFSVEILLLFVFATAIMVYNRHSEGESAAVARLDAPPEPVLVLDPGHGGLDGGATAADGVRESQINLEIALRTENLAKLAGIRTLMTRREEELLYPPEASTVHEKKVWDQKSRVELINGTPGAVLISIHQNRYPDPRPSGSQVLYARTAGSQELGELLHENLITCLCPENRRVAAPVQDSIYLMKQMKCPAILVECGFLSNVAEAQKLQGSNYQISLATVTVASYLQFLE